jgi:hypothetical protein
LEREGVTAAVLVKVKPLFFEFTAANDDGRKALEKENPDVDVAMRRSADDAIIIAIITIFYGFMNTRIRIMMYFQRHSSPLLIADC